MVRQTHHNVSFQKETYTPNQIIQRAKLHLKSPLVFGLGFAPACAGVLHLSYYHGVGGIGLLVFAHGVGGIGLLVFASNQGVGGIGLLVLASVEWVANAFSPTALVRDRKS